MPSRRRTLASLALVLLGTALWIASRGSDNTQRSEGVSAQAADSRGDERVADELREGEVEPTTSGRDVAQVESPVPAESATAEVQGPPEIEEEAPEDPLELGTCSLHLRAVREQTGEPVATYAWVYRLDAPANEAYEAGDQLQAQLQLSEEGAWVRRLPEGRYRVVCWDQPEDEPDPPAFDVLGERTEVELVLAAMPVAEARLLLFDQHGARVDLVERRSIVSASSWSPGPRAEWLTERLPKHGLMVDEEISVSFQSQLGDAQERLEADADGFLLAEVRPETRGGNGQACHELGWWGHNDVDLCLSWDGVVEPTWVGLLLPLAPIARSLWLEDGTRPDSAQLEVEALCSAQPLGELPAGAPWSALTLEVRVRYPGHQELEFSWTPGAGDLADRFLTRGE